MTISTQASTQTFLGNGATQSFACSFVPDSSSFIEVIFTDADNTQTTLSPTQYTISINPVAAGQIWSSSFTITYPTIASGDPAIASGTSLTVTRQLPFTQVISIANQGDFAPQVIEEMGDTLLMQIQQLASRTGQIRGTWITSTDYNYADIVVDGANGGNTGQFYLCAMANTSGTWATDLSSGDWVLAFPAANSAVYDSLTVTGAVTFNVGDNPIIMLTSGGGISLEDNTDGNISIFTLNGGINIFSLLGPVAITSGIPGTIDNFDIGTSTPGTGIFNALTALNLATLSAGALVGANITMANAGNGITLKRGSNGRTGQVTLTGTTAVTVNNTSIITSDIITLSLSRVNTVPTVSAYIKSITANTGFSVAGGVGDNNIYNYAIVRSLV